MRYSEQLNFFLHDEAHSFADQWKRVMFDNMCQLLRKCDKRNIEILRKTTKKKFCFSV